MIAKPPGARPRPDLVSAGLAAATLAGFAGRWHWLADLTSHFRWYWLLAALGWFAVAGRLRGRVAVACLAVAVVGNAWPLAAYWLPPAAAAAAGPQVSLVVLNLLVDHHDRARGIDYLRAVDADVLVLLEVDGGWAAALEELFGRYPYRLVLPRDGAFGIAVLSRLPLEDPRMVEPGGGTPAITATVRPGRAGFVLVAAHPPPPLSAAWSRRRDAELAAIAELAAAADLPVVVAGDLNTTPWSSGFRDLLARGGLRDTALGRGVRGTWHARGWLIRIPIDHVLASPAVGVVSRSVGPDVGSDHLPVAATLTLP